MISYAKSEDAAWLQRMTLFRFAGRNAFASLQYRFGKSSVLDGLTMEQESVETSVYFNSIPSHVEADMERLYQHMYSSYTRMKVYGDIDQTTNAYVVRKGPEVSTILLFRLKKDTVQVLNEQIGLKEEEIDGFSRYIFDTFDSVRLISFPVVRADIQKLSFAFQKFHSAHDIMLSLPASAEEYTAMLGKATRSYVKRYLNKLRRDYEEVRFDVYSKEDADESVIREIIELNRVRMAGRFKSSYIDDDETARILDLVRRRGFVCALRINGRLCAGTINYRFGDNFFLQVVAHDPAYDAYGLGTLCCYLTITKCIEHGGKEYHFLWGQYEYKYRLLGVQQDLDQLTIYRSSACFLLKGELALHNAWSGYKYEVRTWLLDKARRKDDSSLISGLAFHTVNQLRNIKRSMSRVALRKGAAPQTIESR